MTLPRSMLGIWLVVELVHVLACQPERGPCSAADLAATEAAFTADVLAHCAGYTLESCPYTPTARANREAAQQKAGCEP